MGLAVFFLFRSMTKHLRKVRLAAENEAAPPATAGPPAGPGAPGGGPGRTGRVSTGAAATDAAANKEAGRQGS
jgi:hypothetical protein